MPCNDWGSGPGPVYDRTRENALKKRLDKVTNLLCGLMTALDAALYDDEGDSHEDDEAVDAVDQAMRRPALQKWWVEHQAEDRKRAKAERVAHANRRRDLEAQLLSAKRRLQQLDLDRPVDPLDGPQTGDPFYVPFIPGTKGRAERVRLIVGDREGVPVYDVKRPRIITNKLDNLEWDEEVRAWRDAKWERTYTRRRR